jgi:hypothetical protein
MVGVGVIVGGSKVGAGRSVFAGVTEGSGVYGGIVSVAVGAVVGEPSCNIWAFEGLGLSDGLWYEKIAPMTMDTRTIPAAIMTFPNNLNIVLSP